MGNKRQYEVIFAIGAKLAGTFRGTMAAAQSRLHALQATAKRTFSVFKKVALAFGGLGAIFGGFAVTGIITRIFEEAARAAMEAEARVANLTASFMRFGKVSEQVAADQVGRLMEVAKLYGEQGVISETMFAIFAKGMGEVGLWPKLIASAMGPMGDLLAYSKDVFATDEDALRFSRALGRAIQGNTRGLAVLREFGIKMTAEQQKEFKAVSGEVNKLAYIFSHFANKPGIKDFNKKLLETPRGRIKAFQNAMQGMAEEIGHVILQVQGEVAQAWQKVFPVLVPAFKSAITGIGNLVQWAGQQVGDFIAQWQTPAGVLAWDKLTRSFRELGAAVGLFAPTMDGLGKALGQKSIAEAGDTADGISRLANSLRDLQKTMREFSAAAPAFDFMPRLSLTRDVQDLKAFANAWQWVSKHAQTAAENFQKFDNLVTISPSKILAAFKAIGQAAYDWLVHPIDSAVEAYQRVMEAWQHRPWWLGGTPDTVPVAPTQVITPDTIPTLPPTIAYPKAIIAPNTIPTLPPTSGYPKAVAVPHMATGGMVTRPTLATIGEEGPEAVLPLRDASRWLQHQFTRSKAAIETKVNFAPNIVINGNASEAEQRALDTRLRSLVSDFIEQFKAAQYQERRLSYEAGYV